MSVMAWYFSQEYGVGSILGKAGDVCADMSWKILTAICKDDPFLGGTGRRDSRAAP